MSHHEWKALERERDDLMVALMNQPRQVNRIITWLEDEINHNEPILSGKEVLTDDGDTHAIHVGRTELAQGLLKQITEWEKE